MSRQTRRDRRLLDEQQQRAAANKRIGHELAWWIIFGAPAVRWALMLGLPVAAGWWVWTHVDHRHIALALGGLGIVLLVAYAGWIMRNGLHARMMAVARGREINRAMWHLIGGAGALLFAGAIALLRSSM